MRAIGVLRAGGWDGAAIDSVLLDHDHRHRRRLRLTTQAGADLLLDLPQTTHLREGDALVLDDGRHVAIHAAPEPVLDIHAHSPGALLAIAWHLGNRHLPVQLVGERIRIRADHVIAAMVEGLGGHAEALEAPFDPESGAYAAGGHHDHAHGHDHDHEHD
jgi:urease accessory protein